MFRYDIINALIAARGYDTYLEIGLSLNDCFDKIEGVMVKESVDIAGEPTYLMPSDEFFDSIPESMKYDLIFVDGDHSEEQAWCDVLNALAHITEHGAVVVHDCNPPREAHTGANDGGCWMGGVWKVIARLRSDTTLSVVTIDTDCGVAIVERGSQRKYTVPEPMSFAYLDAHRTKVLNLISVEEFVKSL